MIAAEAAPFVKTGGLGDVVGSLPQALCRLGVATSVILPYYQSIAEEYRQRTDLVAELTVPVGWRRQYAGLRRLEHQGVTFYFIENRYYFQRPYMYGFFDEAERYAFFCRAALAALPYLELSPDIIHCHDWHTGLVSVFLDAHYRSDPGYRSIRTLFTIHNLKYQGVFTKQIMGDILGLGWEYFTVDGIEFYDQVNFMKGGIVFSDLVSTVSPTYAEEIKQPFFGENLDGLLRRRAHELYGVLNGIDYDLYNPATDRALFRPYDAADPAGKRDNKIRLQEMLGLEPNADIPLLAIVSRLVSQKGMDLVGCVLEEMLGLGVQLVVVGSGEWRYEKLFRQAAARWPRRVAANICFDETLARRVYAGADLLLMPSLYEPCGIAQLIAMRYGTLPIVRETGGLKDTVVSYNEFTGEGNGFSFTNYNAHDMLYTVGRAVAYFHQREIWPRIVRQAMTGDFGWHKSACQYIGLYEQLRSIGGH